MNILINGATVCILTHSNELLEIEAFNSSDINATNVEVLVELPDGLECQSGTASQGTFDCVTGIWDIGTLTPLQDENNPVTLDICYTILDDSLAPYQIPYTITCEECPDPVPDNNDGIRIIEGTPCTSVQTCVNTILGCLSEYSSWTEVAGAELPAGTMFLASINNTEGWSYRQVLVTPVYSEITLTCPDDISDNCDPETQLAPDEFYPIVNIGVCGTATFVEAIGAPNIGLPLIVGTEWTISYTFDGTECEDLSVCCRLPDRSVTIIAKVEEDLGLNEYTISFTPIATQCFFGDACSAVYKSAIC
jgi:uncharacterized repeat protein (TIGR01451 family)